MWQLLSQKNTSQTGVRCTECKSTCYPDGPKPDSLSSRVSKIQAELTDSNVNWGSFPGCVLPFSRGGCDLGQGKKGGVEDQIATGDNLFKGYGSLDIPLNFQWQEQDRMDITPLCRGPKSHCTVGVQTPPSAFAFGLQGTSTLVQINQFELSWPKGWHPP